MALIEFEVTAFYAKNEMRGAAFNHDAMMLPDGSTVFINPDCIEAIFAEVNDESKILLRSGKAIDVKGTPIEVKRKLING